MIECYVGKCEHHDSHSNPNSGPFCGLDKCVKSSDQIERMVMTRHQIAISRVNEAVAFLKESTMVAVIAIVVIVCAVGLALLATAVGTVLAALFYSVLMGCNNG
jgi:hypothetical protein